jgi:hypothetical protein
LEAIRFLKVLSLSDRYVKRQKNEWVIRLIRESEVVEASAPIVIEESKSLEAELVARGLHASTARELVGQFSEVRIREKISLLDWLTAKGGERSPKNPAGYLAAAIRNDYRPPPDYRIVPPAKEQRTEKRRAATSVAAESSIGQKRLDDARTFFQSLPPEEQSQMESLAVEKGNRFRVETYHRLKETGGRLWDEVRDMLIADVLQTMPELVRPKTAIGDI